MALDRRAILKFIAGGAVGTALTPIPLKLTDDISIWTQNWPWIPNIPKGPESIRPSLVKMGATEYGIRVTSVEGNPITASGNPDHALSQGGIDPLAASCVQMLYSPSRIDSPLVRDNGAFRSVSWARAGELLGNKLSGVKGRADSVGCISGDSTGSVNEVLSAFVSAMGSDTYYFPPSDAVSQSRVWHGLMSGRGDVGYDLENADFILCLGADILESWGTLVRNQKIFARGGKEVVYAGPLQTHTAAVADRWIPVGPDALGHLGLALAYHLRATGREHTAGTSGVQELRRFLEAEYAPNAGSKASGVAQNVVRWLAEKLLLAERPVVVPGTVGGIGGSALPFFAGTALNILLGRINRKGGVRCIPRPPQILDRAHNLSDIRDRDLGRYLHGVAEGETEPPQVLLINEANPAYSLPGDLFSRARKRIPFTVSFTPFMDETAAASDLVLPVPFFLERLEDSFTPFGSGSANYSLASPVISPLRNARPAADFVLGLSRQLGLDLGTDSFRSLLKTKVRYLDADWDVLTGRGIAWTDRTTAYQSGLRVWSSSIRQMLNAARPAAERSPRLALYTEINSGTDRIAIPPFGLKTLLENELQGDTFFLRMNRHTARQHGLGQGDLVKLTTEAGTLQAKVNLDEGVMSDVVAIPTGFGRTAWDKFSRGKGGNGYELLSLEPEEGSGLSRLSAAGLRISKV
jgi:anaerobic selenocysteine-containing dehydrogenase